MTEAARIPLTKAALTKAWRAAKLPRLYWRHAHPDWNWDRGEVARWRDGVAVTHYYSMQALWDEIERMGR